MTAHTHRQSHTLERLTLCDLIDESALLFLGANVLLNGSLQTHTHTHTHSEQMSNQQ